MSSQRTKLIASAKYLELSKGNKVKIWTNSGYVFNVMYVSEVIWMERVLLTLQGNGMEHTEWIHVLLQGIWKSTETAFMHCKIQQNKETTPKLENHSADEIVREAAEKGILTMVSQRGIDLLKFSPKCDQKDHQFSGTRAEIKVNRPEGQVVVPPQRKHEDTHR